MDAVESLQACIARHARRGHFVYESGHHGDLWLDLDALLSDGRAAQLWASELADRARRWAPQVVCGPMTGGARLAEQVALRLGAQFVYTQRTPAAPNEAVSYHLPADQDPIVRGRRVMVIDDAINAGSAVSATLRELDAHGADVVAIGCLLTLNALAQALADARGIPLQSLLQLQQSLWTPAECPICNRT